MSLPSSLTVLGIGSHTTSSQSQNIFVETTLAYALTYLMAFDQLKVGRICVTILADQDYYSPSESLGILALRSKQRFLDFNIPLPQAHKTGLGSSAALVTALTAALIAHYAPHEVADIQSAETKSKLHNLAQAAHCASQGKIGSGFDVAAATYGSCTYRRFSPSILEGLGDIGSNGFAARLKAIVDDTSAVCHWDTFIDKTSATSLPKGLRLLMCDVDCGSETVGMVKKVLEWKKRKPDEAILLWKLLEEANENLAQELHNLSLEVTTAAESYGNLRSIILNIRSLIREMSTKSNVPIEPKVQTELIDACCRIEGVVGGVVPGAGGYDAIVLLARDDQKVVNALSKFLEGYSTERDSTEISIGSVRILGVKQDDKGLIAEDVMQYQEWSR